MGRTRCGVSSRRKWTRVAEIVISSVKPDILLAGKVLGIGAVGLVQQIAWLALSAAAVYFFLPFITHGMMVPKGDAARIVADTAKAVATAGTPPTMAALGLITWPLVLTVLASFSPASSSMCRCTQRLARWSTASRKLSRRRCR